jgi:hypothetical protein
MITMNRQLLSGTPEDVRRTMEDLARDQDDHEYLDGTRFRELAVLLATRDDLAVSAVTSDDGMVYELEVTLTSTPHHDAIVIDRSQPGDHCQMTLERWLPISDEPGVEDAVNTISAILAASARTDPARTIGATAASKAAGFRTGGSCRSRRGTSRARLRVC